MEEFIAGLFEPFLELIFAPIFELFCGLFCEALTTDGVNRLLDLGAIFAGEKIEPLSLLDK